MGVTYLAPTLIRLNALPHVKGLPMEIPYLYHYFYSWEISNTDEYEEKDSVLRLEKGEEGMSRC